MRLAGPALAALAAHSVKVFADAVTWKAHLTALGFDASVIITEGQTASAHDQKRK